MAVQSISRSASTTTSNNPRMGGRNLNAAQKAELKRHGVQPGVVPTWDKKLMAKLDELGTKPNSSTSTAKLGDRNLNAEQKAELKRHGVKPGVVPTWDKKLMAKLDELGTKPTSSTTKAKLGGRELNAAQQAELKRHGVQPGVVPHHDPQLMAKLDELGTKPTKASDTSAEGWTDHFAAKKKMAALLKSHNVKQGQVPTWDNKLMAQLQKAAGNHEQLHNWLRGIESSINLG